MTGCVTFRQLSPIGQRKWPISTTTRTNTLSYHLTFAPLPSQIGFNLIASWCTDRWKSLIFSKPVWAPDCGPGGPRESRAHSRRRERRYLHIYYKFCPAGKRRSLLTLIPISKQPHWQGRGGKTNQSSLHKIIQQSRKISVVQSKREKKIHLQSLA